MEANDPNPEVHGPSPGAGLGERLVVAREARGLSVADIARVLRLPAATLQALESNRQEDLPEPVFVRGYLRAYARLLRMDGEVLVAEYNRLVDTPEPVLTPPTRIRRQATARSPYLRGATALILVVMVVLLGYWWYSRLNYDVTAQSRSVPSEAEQLAASVLQQPHVDSRNPGPTPLVAHPPDIPPQSLANEAVEESVVAVESEPPMGENATAAEPALRLVNDSTVTVIPDAAEQRRNLEVTAEPGVPDLPIAPLASEHGGLVRASRAPTGEDVLVIKADGESWAEVVDANGYQLLYYLLRPGTERSLQGQAPFRVFLGNAPAVELRLNQERFDHKPFQRRNSTARFSIDDR